MATETKTQTALALLGTGQRLQKISIAIPTPAEGEVLLKVTAAGINPMDAGLRDVDFFHLKPSPTNPHILAYDIVGEVISHGPNTDTNALPTGTHVFTQATTQPPGHGSSGGLQEYVNVKARYAIPVPSNISDVAASVFPINAFTSGLSLFSPTAGFGFPLPNTPEAATNKTKTLVIIGGGTNTGRLAVQFARLAQVGRIVAIASPNSAAELRHYGATDVVDRTADDINAEVRKLVPDPDLLYVLDTFNSGPDHTTSVKLVSNTAKGMLIHLSPRGEPSPESLAEKKAGLDRKSLFGASESHPELADVFWPAFVGWVEKGDVEVLRYVVAEGLDADKVNEALDEIGTRAPKAKWAVKV